ncbi:hypothetical protein N657DRAFT_160905 [Parathielavia appendiculata]|uniref:Secreted protein n=1 Tax=Parathielavia appendiculata TaxID=2587402 RepID=A0AAN6TTF5_9PEZI|nr:hypothetical protein N657DRAFT_160905 [Parathielavia appendiculata]
MRPGAHCIALLPSLFLYVVKEQQRQPELAWERTVLQRAQSLKSWKMGRDNDDRREARPTSVEQWLRFLKAQGRGKHNDDGRQDCFLRKAKPTSVGSWVRLIGECYTVNKSPETGERSDRLLFLSSHVVVILYGCWGP